jgi:hypothetical protein
MVVGKEVEWSNGERTWGDVSFVLGASCADEA